MVAIKLAIVGAGALRDLVLVVRKDQVLSATMNVNCCAEVLLYHGSAFDMPAQAATLTGALPAG